MSKDYKSGKLKNRCKFVFYWPFFPLGCLASAIAFSLCYRFDTDSLFLPLL